MIADAESLKFSQEQATPIVSVIIPFFDGHEWLSECVTSVITQHYTHWEIILVDDGSGEQATAIAKRFAELYPGRIFYVDHPGHENRGVTASRNTGIGNSTGSMIAFLDADDKWLPDKLQHQVSILNKHPEVSMICEASLFWHSWINPSASDEIILVGGFEDRIFTPPMLLQLLYPLGTGAAPCPTGIMITKAAFIRSGGFEELFSGEYQLYEDQAFLCKVYLKEIVFISGTANNLYRKREGSLSGSASDLAHYRKVRLFFLNWFENYLSSDSEAAIGILPLVKQAKAENI